MMRRTFYFLFLFSLTVLINNQITQNSWAQGGPPPGGPGGAQETGLLENKPGSFEGYTLLTPIMSSTTWLIDNDGKIVHKWKCDSSGFSGYLLENGNLLRTVNAGGPGRGGNVGGGGATGRVQEYTWDGELVWDFELANRDNILHHGIERMPNGNTLMIVWESKTAEEAIQAGRSPEIQGDGSMMADYIIEVKPTGKTSGEIVWEWHMWDHLVQDYDPDMDNFGEITEHPELIHINPIAWMIDVPEEDMDRLRSLGYLGGGGGGGPDGGPGGRGGPNMNSDWSHTNAVSYNADLDQIALSVLGFSEIWVIDHSTTTKEAASHKGGKSGKGGDLLYRWGNPMAYGAGDADDQQLFTQHDVQWIPKGIKGEGNLIMFNNGRGRKEGDYSSIVEIVPPVDKNGNYTLSSNGKYGPEEPTWIYTAPNKRDFYSSFISGAHRLPNGNTLICSGLDGTLFEVTEEKEIVWKYAVAGGGGPGGFPNPEEMLDRDGDGKITLKEAEEIPFLTKEAVQDLDKNKDGILSGEELQEVAPPGMSGPGGPGGFGGPPQGRNGGPPDFFAMMDRNNDDKLTKEEAADAPFFSDAFFNELDKNGDNVLSKDEMPDGPPPGMDEDRGDRRGRRGRRGPDGQDDRRGPGGPGGFGPPGGRGGRGGPGGPGGGGMFMVRRYAPSYAAFEGKTLTPGKTVEEDQEVKSK